MKIAIPTAGGKLCMHFGHCEVFTLIEADPDKNEILSIDYIIPPPHDPGLYPKWLAAHDVNLIIAGGMGQKAISYFNENRIKVITGILPDPPDKIVNAF